MTYAVKSDIEKLWGSDFIADLVDDGVADVDGAVAEALEAASVEIDGYLSAKYDLPLSNSPAVLKRPCVDIAVYVLANSHTRMTTTMEERYKQAVKFLTLISAGKAGLGADEPSSVIEGSTTGTSSGADFSARPRRFGRGRS